MPARYINGLEMSYGFVTAATCAVGARLVPAALGSHFSTFQWRTGRRQRLPRSASARRHG